MEGEKEGKDRTDAREREREGQIYYLVGIFILKKGAKNFALAWLVRYFPKSSPVALKIRQIG